MGGLRGKGVRGEVSGKKFLDRALSASASPFEKRGAPSPPPAREPFSFRVACMFVLARVSPWLASVAAVVAAALVGERAALQELFVVEEQLATALRGSLFDVVVHVEGARTLGHRRRRAVHATGGVACFVFRDDGKGRPSIPFRFSCKIQRGKKSCPRDT